MGLLSWTAGLPLAPLRGVIGISRVIQRQVDAEMRDPAAVRRRLEAIDEALKQGRIGPDEAARQQDAVTRAMVRPHVAGAVARKPEESER
jgi:gas vesicle protein GvpG